MEEQIRKRPAATVQNVFASLPGRGAVAGALGTARRGVVGFGFWAAVLLPLVYVPHVVTGVQTQADGLLLFALLVAHVVALLVGHGYGQ